MTEPGGAAFGALDATVVTVDNQPEPDPPEESEPAEDEKASD